MRHDFIGILESFKRLMSMIAKLNWGLKLCCINFQRVKKNSSLPENNKNQNKSLECCFVDAPAIKFAIRKRLELGGGAEGALASPNLVI